MKFGAQIETRFRIPRGVELFQAAERERMLPFRIMRVGIQPQTARPVIEETQFEQNAVAIRSAGRSVSYLRTVGN